MIEAVEAILAAVEAAAAGVAGLDGPGQVERGVRLASALREDELPHLFVHNPALEVVEIDYRQEEARLVVSLSLVTRAETQAEALALAAALEAALRADATLEALVRHAFVATVGVREDPRAVARAVELVLSAALPEGI